MAFKRSRKEYEADLQAQQSPFVTYGTPLPPLDPEVRDDGSFVPVWKQEATDEQGRKRFHGAFTGGYSAGYFNTVGSKEGWTPSTFTSSRSSKRSDAQLQPQQRPEDFMDDEDMADAEESKLLQTTQAFAGLGSTADPSAKRGLIMDLLRPASSTAGVRLLQKMGWREGQGIGPKVLRQAHTDTGENSVPQEQEQHLFAPKDSPIIAFVRKQDRHGLGFDPQQKLTRDDVVGNNSDDEGDRDITGRLGLLKKSMRRDEGQGVGRGGIGVGIINDNGSDDEDPYAIGPRISYNRVIGGDKKKNKKKPANMSTANPLLAMKPVFTPKKLLQSKGALQKCHDGRLPLEGFMLSLTIESSASNTSSRDFKIPEIPAGWKSAKGVPTEDVVSSDYKSTADAAKASKLDARSRAAILGEAQLPGKSVFDYLSTNARDRLVSVSGNPNLPPGRGEVPSTELTTKTSSTPGFDVSSLPHLQKEIAVAALGRGIGGWMPYADDEAKRDRYRAFLELQAGIRSTLPERPAGLESTAWMQEFHEFVRAAQVFKPMTGAMASRFTTSTAVTPTAPLDASSAAAQPLLSRPSAAKAPEDPAEAAARMGMFGPMTRSIQQFYPTRLLCKRFNVKPPAHVQPDSDSQTTATSSAPTGAAQPSENPQSMLLLEAGESTAPGQMGSEKGTSAVTASETATAASNGLFQPRAVVDAGHNEALEGKRAGEAVFKAIFGSDDESE